MDTIEAKRKELQEVEQKITKVTGIDPNQRKRRPRRSEDDLRLGMRTTRKREPREDEFEEAPVREGNRIQSVVNATGPAKRSKPDDQPALATKTVASATVITKSERPTSGRRSSARDKRMFGMLMGTLQKASKRAETKSKTEIRMKEVEEKLAEKNEKEREESKQQRIELYQERRAKINELFKLEQEVDLPQMKEQLKASLDPLRNFIKLQAQPAIFFVPGKHNDQTRAMLVESQEKLKADLEAREKEHWIIKELPFRNRDHHDKDGEADLGDDAADENTAAEPDKPSESKVEEDEDDDRRRED